MAHRLVAGYISQLPFFPRDLALQISHVLLAHQGEIEYGSPAQPKTLEALLVHLIDNLDARAAMYTETTANVSPDGWSHYENPLRRALYVPEVAKQLDPRSPAGRIGGPTLEAKSRTPLRLRGESW